MSGVKNTPCLNLIALATLPSAALAAFSVTAIAVIISLFPAGAVAADLAGDCCADLEARIAELEATTAGKDNRKVSFAISGQVNKAALFWDDGGERNAYVVGNKNDQTSLSVTGDAKLIDGWQAGYDIAIRVRDTLSDDVDQANALGSGDPFQLWQAHWWIESEDLGKISVGLASRVSDTAPETDFSEAGAAGYAGVQDVGGAFALRRADGVLIGLSWGDVFNHFNGDTANLVRYDSPQVLGFTASASWSADNMWDVGLSYEGERAGFELGTAIAYSEITDAPSDFADLDQSTLVGSAAVLHKATGLNALVSLGVREFDEAAFDADGVPRLPESAKFVYAKLGWLANLNGFGPTAFYGEYGRFEDFGSVGNNAGLVADLDATGTAKRISGSTAEVWGAGIVQQIEAADLQLYLAYRLHSVDFNFADSSGTTALCRQIDDFHTVMVGSKIAF